MQIFTGRSTKDDAPDERIECCAVDVIVEQALPHRAVTGELQGLDVGLLETGECQDRERILIQRGRADHETDALVPELLDLGDAGVARHAK